MTAAHDQALAWLDEQLAAAGIERTGEVAQPRVRPWGRVIQTSTTEGTVWLKAPGPTTAFEVPLYALLHRVAPDHVLEPIAVDVDRALLLLPDGGPALADRLTGTAFADEMSRVLVQYARMQRALAPHTDELLGLGVADMRPEAMPRQFREALAVVRSYLERVGSTAEREGFERVIAMEETVGSWCERLTALPGQPSLDHNDLHPWNILIARLGTGQVRFYDWGDAVLAHPFASMLVPLGFVQRGLDCRLDAPDLVAVRDAYLAVFADLGAHEELVEALELACRLGKVARALVWHRALTAGGPADDGEFAGAPLETLTSILDDSYLGGG